MSVGLALFIVGFAGVTIGLGVNWAFGFFGMAARGVF